MNEIRIFEKPEFGSIRTTIDENGEPWFCLADVAKVLDLHDHKIRQRLEEGVLSKYPLETNGGKQLVNFINEDGLYDAIFDSRKPEAKAFRKWVTKEVLPSIRKTGEYSLKDRRKNPYWKAARLDGISSRKTLTDSVRDSGEQERMRGHGYVNYTNLAYKMALGTTTNKYKKTHGIDKKTNLRDCLDEVELQKLKTAECFLQAMLVLGYQYGQIVDIMEKKSINNK